MQTRTIPSVPVTNESEAVESLEVDVEEEPSDDPDEWSDAVGAGVTVTAVPP